MIKLKLPFTVPNLEQLSNGKFQYNMECIQWLYDYAVKHQGKNSVNTYSGYLRRQEALLRQLHAKGMYLEISDYNPTG